MDYHGSDYIRAVVSCHSPGETGTSTAAASHVKPYYTRPQSLRHEFGDEYAYFARGPYLGLAAASTIVSTMNTLVNRCPIQLFNGS